MKQTLILCFLAICSFFCCTETVAQGPKFVIVNATDLNIRKAPNTQAPRLMVDHSGEGFDSDIYVVHWSNEKLQRGYKREPFHPRKGDVLEVVKTQGDWTQVKVVRNDETGEVTCATKVYYAWVASKFLQDIKPVPFERPSGEMFVEDYPGGQILKRGGRYDGYMLEVEEGMYTTVRLSRIVDGVKVCIGTMVDVGFNVNEYSEEMKGMVIEREEFMFSICVGKDRRCKVNGNEYYDFNKFTDSEIDILYKEAKPEKTDYLYTQYRFKNPFYNPREEYSEQYLYCNSVNE